MMDNNNVIGEKSDRGCAVRQNINKLRYELVHPNAHADLVKVLSIGAKKYSPNNWTNGFAWTSIIASLKRHIAAFEMGEDYDPETGELHIAHAACNVHFLNAYYYIFPQGDDRNKNIYITPKIGLDVDQVLGDFVGRWNEYYPDCSIAPKYWNYDRKMGERFSQMKIDNTLDEFYLGIKPMINGQDLPFEPHCYITSRPVSKKITEDWLDMHNFPNAPVISLGIGESKVGAAKEMNVEIFIDDSINNFVELNKNGIFTYLFSSSYNEKYDVGHMRLNTLNDLPHIKYG